MSTAGQGQVPGQEGRPAGVQVEVPTAPALASACPGETRVLALVSSVLGYSFPE